MIVRLLRIASLLIVTLACVVLIAGTAFWAHNEPDILKGSAVMASVGGVLIALGAASVVHAARITWRDVGVLFVSGLVPLYALLVSMQTGLSRADMSGVAFEPGTVASVIGSMCAVVAGYLFVRLFRLPLVLAIGIVVGSVIVGGGYVVGQVVPALAPLDLFGGWFSMQLLFAVGFLCALRLIDRPLPAVVQAIAAAAALFFVLLLLTSHSYVLVLGTAVAGMLFVGVVWYTQRADQSLYWARLVVVGVVLVLALSNAQSVIARSGIVTTPVEIRPSVQLSTHVLLSAYAANPETLFIGTGEQFAKSWNRHRPERINQTSFWDTDFSTPSGTVIALLLTYGAVAGYALVLLLVYWCSRAVEYAADAHMPRHLRTDSVLYGVIVVFGSISMSVYAPNLAFLVLWALSLGVLLGILSHRSAHTYQSMIPAVVLALSLVVIGGAAMHASWNRYLALQEYAIAQRFAANEGGFEEIEHHLKSSLAIDPLPHVARALSERYEVQIRTAMVNEPDLAEERILVLAGWANSGGVAAALATDLDSEDYRNWIQLGDIKVFRALFEKNPELFSEAEDHYKVANSLAPQSPLPHFLRAQAAYLSGEHMEAGAQVERALQLKREYADAVNLRAQINAVR